MKNPLRGKAPLELILTKLRFLSIKHFIKLSFYVRYIFVNAIFLSIKYKKTD